ncbi:hypothetical protein MNB_SM-3-57 [hydrothermal vent metagenome]|uniref:Uncharacterized protein n=1 Tax=hydrothermal vent metagenome TaxID=652676 RepID=A0A1W1D4Y8_9ZZZZ
MNRINPLHIISLLVVILFFSYFQLSKVKQDITIIQKELQKRTDIALELVALKKVYNKKQLLRKLSYILQIRAIKQANIQTTYHKSGVTLQAKTITLIPLNLLMKKLLNNSFNIKKIKIKKLDDKKATMEVEIKW